MDENKNTPKKSKVKSVLSRPSRLIYIFSFTSIHVIFFLVWLSCDTCYSFFGIYVFLFLSLHCTSSITICCFEIHIVGTEYNSLKKKQPLIIIFYDILLISYSFFIKMKHKIADSKLINKSLSYFCIHETKIDQTTNIETIV